MSTPNYLIDTNIFIGLEDPKEVSGNLAALLQLAGRHNVGVFVHEAALDDIKRDKNDARRKISLSKLDKFQRIAKVRGLAREALEGSFGPLPKPNDVVDATLLHSLDIGVADFLVTEDRGLHERARRHAPQLVERILYAADAVSLLRSTYEPVNVPLRYVEEVEANSIPLSDPIFESLRDGYPGFDKWWRDKCVKPMRKCWVVVDGSEMAGLVVRKDETDADTDARLPGQKILKICTFKVRPEKRGVKLGELLLKQILWFAHSNRYDLVYLTTYREQSTLIDLLQYYGFVQSYEKPDGELVLEKPMAPDASIESDGRSPFEAARTSYPRLRVHDDIAAYTIPIRAAFHDILFPELAQQKQIDLFGPPTPRRAGNTIRKVYLCRAPALIREPGAMLIFYKGKAYEHPSQAVTAVGIFEDMTLASSAEELRRLAGGRSVYSDAQLRSFAASPRRPVKVINFLLASYLEPPAQLHSLVSKQIFSGHPPQSIARLTPSKLRSVLQSGHVGFVS